jgi:lantibiotic modifying enzyme
MNAEKDETLIEKYITANLQEKQMIKEHSLILKVVEHLPKIKSQLLNTDIDIKVEGVKYFPNKGTASITFTNKHTILYKEGSLENEEITNSFIEWLNRKLRLNNCNLTIRKVLNCGEYGFLDAVDSSECKDGVELLNYYFKAGEFLVILYVLNCTTLTDKNIIDINQCPVLQDIKELFITSNRSISSGFISGDIAKAILEFSVYNIEFLSVDKRNVNTTYLEAIKKGFKHAYETIVQNKFEAVKLMECLFTKKPLCLGTILLKLSSLNMDDMKRQLYFLDVRYLGNKDEKTKTKFLEYRRPSKIDKEYVTSLACTLANHLINKSIIGVENFKPNRTWISTINDSDSGRGIVLLPIGNSLCSGNSGVALFFSCLSIVSEEDYFMKVAKEALQGPIRHLRKLINADSIIQEDCNSVIGEVYVLLKIYSLGKNEYVKDILDVNKAGIIRMVKEYISLNLEEAAGAVASLLAAYKSSEIKNCEDLLVELAQISYENIKYKLDNHCLDYENDGVIALLSRLLIINSNKQIERTIKKMLSLQRLKFSKNNIQTMDFCKGNVYFLLSRLMLKEACYDDPQLDEEIKNALEYTIKDGFGSSPYYHNGDLGSLAILEYAAEVLKDVALKDRCINTFNYMVKSVIKTMIKEEIAEGNKPISLMNGIVGLGYSLVTKCNEDLQHLLLWFLF